MKLKTKLLEPKNLIALAVLIFSLISGISFIDTPEIAKNQPLQNYSAANDNIPDIRGDWAHIMYGDRTGGGHLYGTGKPCKSEFPRDWDETAIKSTLTRMAANDNANWRREDNGYYVSEQMEGEIRVRVVLNGQKSEIVTGYPTNVPRNPCPARKNRY